MAPLSALLSLCEPDDVGVSCVIVDDSVEFLEVARSLLEREGVQVVGVATTGSAGLERISELRPHVALVDIDLGADSGFDVARRIAQAGSTSVILVSTHSGADFTELIAASPAAGFIPKSELSAQAIHRLLDPRSGDGASAIPGT